MKKALILIVGVLAGTSLYAAEVTVEELRIERARTAMPSVVDRWSGEVDKFASSWNGVMDYPRAKRLLAETGEWLWREAKRAIHKNGDFDDRPVYWTRLALSEVVRIKQPGFTLSESERVELLELLEQTSRGRQDLEFSSDAPVKILITGFDPFLLDRNIQQGNPSGIAALLLDDQLIEYQGKRAEINTVLFPVRYEDFDHGEVETLLAPYYMLGSVDMVITISQGRSDFDLERFPGRRRSVTAPDNLNVLSGGNSKEPVISRLGRSELPGPEFVEFSLPVAQMLGAKGPYKINDNNKVATVKRGYIEPETLAELSGAIAVSGSGGGYLSNEISFRSIRLRNQFNSQIPTGHIHTPVLKKSVPEEAQPIIDQLRDMLKRGLSAL